MADGLRNNLSRGRFLIMLVGALTVIVAFWFLCMAAIELKKNLYETDLARHFILIAALLLVVSIVCFITLIVRYISMATLRNSMRHEPTEYVNAWQIASQRIALEEDQLHEPGSDDVHLQADDDGDYDDESGGYDDGYGDDEDGKPY